jgi:hypothetical protein
VFIYLSLYLFLLLFAGLIWRLQQHWNSFTTNYFVPIERVIQVIETRKYLELDTLFPEHCSTYKKNSNIPPSPLQMNSSSSSSSSLHINQPSTPVSWTSIVSSPSRAQDIERLGKLFESTELMCNRCKSPQKNMPTLKKHILVCGND